MHCPVPELGMTDHPDALLRYRFPAETSQLRAMRDQLTESLASMKPSKAFIHFVVLAVNEAVCNVIQHAYGENDSGDIILEVQQLDNALLFRLTDFARRKSTNEEMQARDLDEIRPGGLGCHIINEVMDDVTVVESGTGEQTNVLEMTKRLVDQ